MIKSIFKVGVIALATASMTGCLERIETGSVGVRVNMSKEVQGTELMPGSWNQTLVGSVLKFPIKDISVSLDNKTPMTSENTALADFDITIVYAINPSSVAELYSTKSKSFHTTEADGDVLLMHNYMATLVNNASYKVVRNYTNLAAADNRQKIEEEIRAVVNHQLREEKLDQSLTLNVVQVRNILPNAAILQSATDLVRSQNELKVKENEVKIAEAEGRKQKALGDIPSASIELMKANATVTVANAIAQGKVQTIILSADTTSIFNLGK